MIYLGNSPVGVAVGVGEFTQYKKAKMTFQNAENACTSWGQGAVIPCEFTPKLILVYANATETEGVVTDCVIVCDFNQNPTYSLYGGIGDVGYINPTTHAYNVGAVVVYPLDGTNHAYANSRAQYYNNTISICRLSANAYWSNTIEYTVEIYG